MLKLYIKFNAQKNNRNRTKGGKDGKAFYELMINVIYGKTKENMRNRIDVRLVNKKDLLKWTLKLSFVTKTIW